MNIYCNNLYKRRLLRKMVKNWSAFFTQEKKAKFTHYFSMKLIGDMELLKQGKS